MTPILVYGFPLGSSMGLVAALELLGQPFRLCRVDMMLEMKNERYARLNGRQETPVLIGEDGRVLTETMAILGWLERRDTDRRLSFALGSRECDRMRQLAAFVNTGFTSAFGPLWTAYETADGDPGYLEALHRYGRDGVAERHEKLEAMVPGQGYLVAERISLADMVLAGVARWADFHQAVDRDAYPRLAALRKRIEEHPSVRFATAIEDGDNPTGSGAFQGHVELGAVIRDHGG